MYVILFVTIFYLKMIRFVTFATEVEARAALSAIANAKFENTKIKARLKTESFVKYQR